MEAHDLAASKLVAGREKDRVFVATLLQERLIDSGVLLERVARLPVGPARKDAISKWVEGIAADVSQ